MDYLQSQHIDRGLTKVRCSYEVADSFIGLYLLMDDGCESCLLWNPSFDKVSSIAWLGSVEGLYQSRHGEDEVRVVQQESNDLLGYALILMDSSCVQNLDSCV